MENLKKVNLFRLATLCIASCFFYACQDEALEPAIDSRVQQESLVDESTNDSNTSDIESAISSEVERTTVIGVQREDGLASTELYVGSGQSIKVSIELVQGSKLPTIILGRYAQSVWLQSVPEYTLMTSEVVEIKNSGERDALVYINCEDLDVDSEINVSIDGGHEAPHFILSN